VVVKVQGIRKITIPIFVDRWTTLVKTQGQGPRRPGPRAQGKRNDPLWGRGGGSLEGDIRKAECPSSGEFRFEKLHEKLVLRKIGMDGHTTLGEGGEAEAVDWHHWDHYVNCLGTHKKLIILDALKDTMDFLGSKYDSLYTGVDNSVIFKNMESFLKMLLSYNDAHDIAVLKELWLAALNWLVPVFKGIGEDSTRNADTASKWIFDHYRPDLIKASPLPSLQSLIIMVL